MRSGPRSGASEPGAGGAEGRVPRFAIRASLQYWQVGQSTWCEVRTENISRSGLLFHADDVLPPDTPEEMRLTLWPETGARATVTVWCRGVMVRSVRSSTTDSPAAPAAAFSRIPPPARGRTAWAGASEA